MQEIETPETDNSPKQPSGSVPQSDTTPTRRRRWLLRSICGLGAIGIGSAAMLAMADRNLVEEGQARAVPLRAAAPRDTSANTREFIAEPPRIAQPLDARRHVEGQVSLGIARTIPAQFGNNVAHGFPGNPIARFDSGEISDEEREVQNLLSKIRTKPGEQDTDQIDKLKQLLTSIFEAKHTQQLERLDRIRQQLTETETVLELREEKKDEIIERRLRELLGQRDPMNFNWEYPSPTAKGLPGSKPARPPASDVFGSQDRFQGSSNLPGTFRSPSANWTAPRPSVPSSLRAPERGPGLPPGLIPGTNDRSPRSESPNSGQRQRQDWNAPSRRPNNDANWNPDSRYPSPENRSDIFSNPALDVGDVALRLSTARQASQQLKKLLSKGMVPNSEYERLRSEVANLERSLEYLVGSAKYEYRSAQTRLEFAQRKLENLMVEIASSNSRNEKLKLQREQLAAEEEVSLLKLQLETAAERLRFVEESLKQSKGEEDKDQASDLDAAPNVSTSREGTLDSKENTDKDEKAAAADSLDLDITFDAVLDFEDDPIDAADPNNPSSSAFLDALNSGS